MSECTKTDRHNESALHYIEYMRALNQWADTAKKYRGKARRLLARLLEAIGQDAYAEYVRKLPYIRMRKVRAEDGTFMIIFKFPPMKKRISHFKKKGYK